MRIFLPGHILTKARGPKAIVVDSRHQATMDDLGGKDLMWLADPATNDATLRRFYLGVNEEHGDRVIQEVRSEPLRPDQWDAIVVMPAYLKPRNLFEGHPEESYETTKFGRLAPGEQFISLPTPGDNDGHGGFKGVHNLMMKTTISGASGPNPYNYVATTTGLLGHNPDSMDVIVVR
ncbi:hypothetical protein CMO91_01615 [Candidatus Woesearchaeota archaeon]|nr:hypothetical protein [Candidatus Woesearchaeota archaeon]